jgi:hypothetical protein
MIKAQLFDQVGDSLEHYLFILSLTKGGISKEVLGAKN